MLSYRSERAPRQKSGHSVVELGVGVFLLIIFSLLCANIYVIYEARSYNDRICRESIEGAASAALDGENTDMVMSAARQTMEQRCGFGGNFFVEHPQFTLFKDEMKDDVRTLKIQTKTLAHLPVPILVYNPKSPDPRTVTFTSTYLYKIKNPRRVQAEQ